MFSEDINPMFTQIGPIRKNSWPKVIRAKSLGKKENGLTSRKTIYKRVNHKMSNEHPEIAKSEWIMVVLFIPSLISSVVHLQVGDLDRNLEPSMFNSWLTLLVGFLISMCALIAAFGLALYSQNGRFRDYLISLTNVDIIVMSLLFSLTYPTISFSRYFPVSIATSHWLAYIMIFVPVAAHFVQVFSKNQYLTRNQEIVVLLLTLGLVPLAGLLVVFLPFNLPLIINDSGITAFGVVATGLGMMLAIPVFLKYLHGIAYNRNPMNLAMGMTFSLVLLAIISTGSSRGLTKFTHLVALAFGTEALTFMLIGMVSTYSRNQHLVLQKKVERQTREIAAARDESDFYLYLWSHEVGNLLQALLFYLDIFEMKEDSGSEILPSIHSASELATRITDILNRVKELAELRGKQEKQLKPINLRNAIERSVTLVEDMLADHEFVVNYTEVDDCTIRADELVEQVFVNLIENSVEHCSSTRPIIEIASKETNSTVLLYFRDNCPSLPKRVKLSLFDEFAPSKEGLGLGLFVVKKLMTRYNSDVRYSELENKQKEFVLTFQKPQNGKE